MGGDETALDPTGAGATHRRPNLPGYTLLGVAGQGGMGMVYRAEQASPRRVVAVKVLSAASASAESLAAFRREAQLIAQLEHPHILPLYGFGEVDGQPYLVLRYLKGGSVADRLAQGDAPLDLRAAARWVRSVAEALDFAHNRGLVHRDVKPSNVMLDDAGTGGNAYLTDFGIAGNFAAPGGGVPLGSAPYMSPEQGRGQSVDKRADVYSLAVTLFEMLTGQKPYTAETALGMVVRHINDPIPSARALNPAIPLAVDELIQWAMAKQPEERPQTAAEFARLLGQALAKPDARLRPPVNRPGYSPTMVVDGQGAGYDLTKLGEMPAAGARPGYDPTMLVGTPGSAPAGAVRPAYSPTIRVDAPAAPAVAPRRGATSPTVWIGVLLVGACIVGVVALGGGAAILGLFAPRATATIQPTSTAPPTAAPTAAAPTPEGQLVADDFSDGRSGFAVRHDEDGGVAYANGVYRITVLTKGIEWASPSGRVSAQDVVIDVDLAAVGGPAKNEIALLCRVQDDTHYTALALSGEGEAAIWQKQGDETAHLLPWTGALALATGAAPSHLTATCIGDQLKLEADGQVVAEASDPAPAAGDVGVLAGLREAGQLTVDFDNLAARQP